MATLLFALIVTLAAEVFLFLNPYVFLVLFLQAYTLSIESPPKTHQTKKAVQTTEKPKRLI